MRIMLLTLPHLRLLGILSHFLLPNHSFTCSFITFSSGLGTHVSKVRSLGMDEMEPEVSQVSEAFWSQLKTLETPLLLLDVFSGMQSLFFREMPPLLWVNFYFLDYIALFFLSLSLSFFFGMAGANSLTVDAGAWQY